MQLPMVLALWLKIQRGPLRQVERLRMSWHAVLGHIKMPSANCSYTPILPDPSYIDLQTNPSPAKIFQ